MGNHWEDVCSRRCSAGSLCLGLENVPSQFITFTVRRSSKRPLWTHATGALQRWNKRPVSNWETAGGSNRLQDSCKSRNSPCIYGEGSIKEWRWRRRSENSCHGDLKTGRQKSPCSDGLSLCRCSHQMIRERELYLENPASHPEIKTRFPSRQTPFKASFVAQKGLRAEKSLVCFCTIFRFSVLASTRLFD